MSKKEREKLRDLAHDYDVVWFKSKCGSRMSASSTATILKLLALMDRQEMTIQLIKELVKLE